MIWFGLQIFEYSFETWGRARFLDLYSWKKCSIKSIHLILRWPLHANDWRWTKVIKNVGPAFAEFTSLDSDFGWIAMDLIHMLDYHGFPWIPMGFHEFSMNFDGFWWISMDFHGFAMNFDGSWWFSMNSDGFPWISMDFQWILLDFDGFPMNFDEFWWILMNFVEFRWILMGFLWILMDFDGFWMDFQYAPWDPGAGRSADWLACGCRQTSLENYLEIIGKWVFFHEKNAFLVCFGVVEKTVQKVDWKAVQKVDFFRPKNRY